MQNFIFKYWYLALFLCFSILSYLSVFISPVNFWPAVFISYAIPGGLLLNVILFIIVLFYKKRLIVFPLTALILGLPFVFITLSYKSQKTTESYDLSILSFNVRYFQESRKYRQFSSEMVEWVAKDSSQIKCIQEYSSNEKTPGLQVAKLLKGTSYNSAFSELRNEKSVDAHGIAIFTTYDILDTGMVWTDNYSINVAMFADVKKGEDTIRIYNVHLASMGLEISQYKNPDRYRSKMKRLVSRLKYGAEKRSSQIDQLISHTNNCPYPYVICGDFNETPYSANYFKLRRHFSNAFEKAGNGFGFSFNSILFFLRIDHHFFSNEIEAIDFRVDRRMELSDHYPIRGLYKIRRN